MADRVEDVLEQMVPELDELARLQLLSSKEVQALVRRRRSFEYAMNRRMPIHDDFLRAISFELNAETLVKGRKRKLGLDVQLIADYAFKRRVFFLYDRALRKFSADLELWQQYLDYAIRSGSQRVLGKAFARALQLHPTVPSLWIKAMAWEFDHNNNIVDARLLMQRAIRMNKSRPHQLYLAFYKLELQYVRRLRRRRQLLSIDDAQDDMAEFLSGVVPKLVFDRARQDCPDNVDFIIQFGKLTKTSEFPELCEHIYGVLTSGFPKAASAWVAIALYRIECGQFASSLERERVGVEVVVTALNNAFTTEAASAVVAYFQSRIQTSDCAIAREMLLETMSSVLSRSVELKQVSEELFVTWAQISLRSCVDGVRTASSVLHIGVEHFPRSKRLSTMLLQLELTSAVAEGDVQLRIEHLKQTAQRLTANSGGDVEVVSALSVVLVRGLVLSGADDATLEAALVRGLPGRAAQLAYLEWGRTRPHRLPNVVTAVLGDNTDASLYLAALRMPLPLESLRRTACEATTKHADDAELWAESVRIETAHGELARAEKLKWKARKSAMDPQRFVQLLQQN